MDNLKFINYIYKEKYYKCRYIYHEPANATILVGPDSLYKQILLDELNDQARLIDEDIYCYVPDKYRDLSEKELKDYLKENFD